MEWLYALGIIAVYLLWRIDVSLKEITKNIKESDADKINIDYLAKISEQIKDLGEEMKQVRFAIGSVEDSVENARKLAGHLDNFEHEAELFELTKK